MASRPNVLVFMPDAVQAGVVGPDSVCRTPNFDRLASRGVRFTNAHTVAPVCSPARASFMTGLLPHNHGVLQVEHSVADDQSVLRAEQPHWAQRLVEVGYRTAYFGKWHIERSNELERFGWQTHGGVQTGVFRNEGAGHVGDTHLIRNSPLVRYLRGPEGYNDILHYAVTSVPMSQRRPGQVTAMARDFITDAVNRPDPWACVVSFPEPNTPVIAGIDAYAQYDVDDIEMPPNFGDPLDGRPGIYRRIQRTYRPIQPRQWRELRAAYYALVTELDGLFGQLLDTLENTGQLDNTIIVLLTDHGRYLGAHGLDAHNFAAFEEIYNIPLIVAGPGVARGAECTAAVTIADLCPTILELSGAKPIDVPDSQSVVPMLRDPASPLAKGRIGYAEFHGTRFLMTQRIVWDPPWKFVFNGFDEDELYNLALDPHELTNLALDPAHGGRVKRMMSQIWERITVTDDRALLDTHYSPMRFAAIGPITSHKATEEAAS